MKKNEKGFVQNEKDLENVAGGFGGKVDVDVTLGDVSLYTKTDIKKSEYKSDVSKSISTGDISGSIIGTNFTAQ